MILNFPKTVRKTKLTKRVCPRPLVHPFPSMKHVRMVANVARTMHEYGGVDAAERHLTWHLEIHCDRLLSFHVPEPEVEAECRSFAAAAWKRYFEIVDQLGVA